MAEKSYYWEGLITGDATEAPYSSDIFHFLWQTLFSRGNNEGIIENYLNELQVSGVSGAVNFATGAALVDGSFYENTNGLTFAVLTPSANPRTDRLVLQKNWITQTIRAVKILGNESATPVPPPLTQTDGFLWEIPIAQIQITTAGVISVVDERRPVRTILAPVTSMEEIETIQGDDVSGLITFSNIPNRFKHLYLVGNLSVTSGSVLGADLFLNGDTDITNYNRHQITRFSGAVASAGNVGTGPLLTLLGVGSDRDVVQKSCGLEIYFANYSKTDFYKTALSYENNIPNETVGDFRIRREGGIRKNTNVIHTISLQTPGIFADETILSLYGI